MLNELGLDSDHVHRASAHETIYQAVMRTSLRDPNSTTKVHAIVADEPSATRLAELVGADEVVQIGTLEQGSRIVFNDTDKKKRQAAKKVLAGRNVPEIPPNPYINENGVKSGTLVDAEGPLDGSTNTKESVGFASGCLASLDHPLGSSSVNSSEPKAL